MLQVGIVRLLRKQTPLDLSKRIKLYVNTLFIEWLLTIKALYNYLVLTVLNQWNLPPASSFKGHRHTQNRGLATYISLRSKI